jgi:outer membrane receptor protein involved in Fe transport
VLRGPQSARFGSSALAGVVYAQSAAPGDEFAARAELTGGSDDLLAAGAALGGPLSASLKGRVAVYQYTDNGFRNNRFLGRDDTNERDELSVRAKLDWEFNQNWNALLTLLYADFDNSYDAFALDNSANTFSDEPGSDSQETEAASLRLTGLVTEAAELTSISSVSSSEILFSYDGDWQNELAFLPIITDYRYINPRERDSVSQEFRLASRPEGRLFGGSTDWVVGVFWRQLDEDNRIDSTGVYVQTDIGCPPLPDPFACITDRQVMSEFSSDSLALFGGLDVRLSDQLTLSAGLRYEDWDADYSDAWIDNGVFGGPISVENSFAPDDSLLGGHLALQYDWNDVVSSYARVARGFKAGGFNPSVAALGALSGAPAADLIPYANEYLWNYEIGTQWSGLSGMLFAEAIIYYMDRDDAQLSQSDQVDPLDPNTFFFITSNGEANSYGFESNITWQIDDNWRLRGALGWMESEIDFWPVRPEVQGRELAHAPAWNVSVGVSWEGATGWFAHADAVAVDEFYFDIGHDQQSGSYALINASIGKRWDNWSATLWGRNVFDEDYATRGFFFGNEPPLFEPTLYKRFGDPRQIGFTIAFEY